MEGGVRRAKRKQDALRSSQNPIPLELKEDLCAVERAIDFLPDAFRYNQKHEIGVCEFLAQYGRPDAFIKDMKEAGDSNPQFI